MTATYGRYRLDGVHVHTVPGGTVKKLKTLDRYMTASQCADAAGIKLDTFTAYVNRKQCPQPVLEVAGRRMYDREEIAAWIAAREARASKDEETDE